MFQRERADNEAPHERLVVLAEELGAAAGLVGDRDDTVDVRVGLLDVAERVVFASQFEVVSIDRSIHSVAELSDSHVGVR